MDELRTSRLGLRRWTDADRGPFAAMNADPAVMELMPSLLDRAQSDASVDRIERHFAEHGFGLWAVEALEGRRFLGFVGLSRPTFSAPFTPCVEIGWRLAREAWGHGYAREAAREVCRAGFEELALPELVSMTTTTNLRSRRVMESLGMTHEPADDFDHPRLAEGHPLRRHVLYRLSRARYAQLSGARPTRS